VLSSSKSFKVPEPPDRTSPATETAVKRGAASDGFDPVLCRNNPVDFESTRTENNITQRRTMVCVCVYFGRQLYAREREEISRPRPGDWKHWGICHTHMNFPPFLSFSFFFNEFDDRLVMSRWSTLDARQSLSSSIWKFELEQQSSRAVIKRTTRWKLATELLELCSRNTNNIPIIRNIYSCKSCPDNNNFRPPSNFTSIFFFVQRQWNMTENGH
jgi:hypothetical protein